MRGPDRDTLTDAAPGRVSMPFLPTLAVVAALGVASLYCPSPRSEAPVATDPSSIAPIAFAPAAALPGAPARRPASLAFADLYPIPSSAPSRPAPPAPSPLTVAAQASPAAASAHSGAHPALRLATAAKRPCPGRRCPETPLRGPEPLGPARAGIGEPADPAESGLPPGALPFASMAETLAPAAHALGEAADFLRGGAASAKGAVALAVAECLR